MSWTERAVIRAMTRSELDVLVDWAAAEGWNPGLEDAEVFWDTDPEGFVAAELDGRLAGGGSAVAYGRACGFMGFFIVRRDLRGQRLGDRIWQARERLERRLDPGAPIGMDGVVAMQDFYARGGFTLSHRDLRHAFTASDAGPQPGVVPAAQVPFEALAAFDAARFPAPRPRFLRRWLSLRQGTALASRSAAGLDGLGVIRRCREGHKVGPLLATSPEVAERLLRALAATVPGETVYLDTPGNNPDARELACRWGMRLVFECGRMYRGALPPLPVRDVYGVTTFELG